MFLQNLTKINKRSDEFRVNILLLLYFVTLQNTTHFPKYGMAAV